MSQPVVKSRNQQNPVQHKTHKEDRRYFLLKERAHDKKGNLIWNSI